MRRSISVLSLIAVAIFSGCGFAEAENLIGKVISTQDNRLYVAQGEKITVDLGTRNGILKGDILTLIKRDGNFRRKAGLCLVVSAKKDQSLCKILKTDTEIGLGDEVEARQVFFFNPELKEPFLTFFSEILEGHDPERKASIFLGGIFDRDKNLTSFSFKLGGELENFLSSKSIFKVRKDDERIKRFRDFLGYPEDYFPFGKDTFYVDEVSRLKGLMRTFDLDILILGSYREEKSKVVVSLYSVDRLFGERKIEFDLPLEQNVSLMRQIVEPYSPKTRKGIVSIRLSLERKHFFPTVGEQKRVMRDLTHEDPEFRYLVMQRKVSFDRISPERVQIVLNGKPVKVVEGEESSLEIDEGSHTLSVSFSRALFFGLELLYVMKQKETKDVILELKGREGEPVFINIVVSADPKSEPITFDVFRRSEDKKVLVRPIATRKSLERVELYLD